MDSKLTVKKAALKKALFEEEDFGCLHVTVRG